MFNPFKRRRLAERRSRIRLSERRWRKRKPMVTVEIEDRSKDKEAVFVRLNGMRIAFPAYSGWKIEELIDELAHGLGFTAEVSQTDNIKAVEIRRT